MKKHSYFLSKILFVLLLMTLIMSNAKSQTTYYTYKSGSWNDIDTWTTDPGGTTLVGSALPTDGDAVVILMSRTVTLTNDTATTTLDITINSGGILDIGDYSFTGGLTALRGEGTLKLSSANFPTATTNTFVQTDGGTTEYYNSSDFTLPVAQTEYNNLTLDLSTTSIIATQLSNITLNGDLLVKVGIYQINDDTGNRRQLTINGDVTVNSGSSMTVGTGVTNTTTDPTGISGGTAPFIDYYDAQSHRVAIYGDFTNNGTVSFTNLTYPVYDAFPSTTEGPTTGFATVYFLGSTDNTLTCNNTTDFYNLVVDKGTDQTFQLSVNSSDYPNFRLFGANTSGGENGGDNPLLKKALWLRNGTLRLFGKVVIPSLSEGTCDGGLSGGPNSDYFIPANAALVIDGPDVIVLTTADDYTEINAAYGTAGASNAAMGVNSSASCSSFSILGKFQIDDGYISTRESGGFIYWASSSGEFIVNGGTLDAKQFRTANASGGLTAYRQTGGTFNLRGRIKNDISGVSAVADLTAVPLSTTQSTGGIQSAVGTFNIARDDNIFEMTGGIIKIYDVCGISGGISRAYEVNSLPAYYSVSGGEVQIIPTAGTGTDYDYYIASSAPIYDLTIDDSNASGTFDVILTYIPENVGYVTERLNPPLTISNDLTLSNNATLNSNNYEVQIGGNFDLTSASIYTPGTNKTTFNGSGYQTFTAEGTITSGLYKLNIDKSADTLIFDGVPATYTIRDSLEIFGGVLDDGGKTLNVAGNIYNAGEHIGTGKILLNGTSTQTLEASVFSSPTLGNLELSNGIDPGAQLISDFTASVLTLTANTGGLSIFDIQDYRLTLTGGVVQTSGTLAFGDDKMVRTSGASSAKGLKVSISLTGAGSPDYLFPIGVDDSGTNEYNPYILLTPGDPGTTTGTINVVPVNSYHPTVKTQADVIQFFWKVDASGFAGATAAGFQYYFAYFGNILANQQKAAYLDYESVDGWVTANGSADKNNDDITFFTGLGFLSTDFTAGKQAAFNKPRILYSRASDDWDLITTWSETAFGGAQAAKAPLTYDRFIIGGAAGVNHIVDIDATGLATIAGVEIYSSEATGISGTPPTLNNPAGNTGVDLTSVSGGGRYVQNDNDLPSGDFGDFCNNDTAIFEYSTGTYNIPTGITVYPNLHITSDAVDMVKTLPNSSILVQNELVLSTASTGNTLRFNNAGGDLIVYEDVALDNEANLEFDGASVQNLNIYGDLDLDYDDSGTSANTLGVNTGTAAHKINFYGDSIIIGASAINVANGTLSILDSLNTVIPDGTGTITLSKLTINKNNLTDTVKISEDFTLNGTTNSSPKALTLTQGTLILENTSTDVELSSSGDFNIPQTSALILKDGASVNVIGLDAGIFLDGLLSADSTSVIDLGDGSTGDTRYIEYSGSGMAEIILTESASLTVNSQIRRSLSQTNGVLKFDQSGSVSTIIYGRGGSATRSKFEVVNPGSEFNMTGGSFTILRGGGTTYGDLFLRPATGGATGGTITLGSVDVGVQTIKFDSEIALNTLLLDGVGSMNTFQLMVNPLVMNGDLTINTANSTLYANGIDVTLKGDLTNNGTYTPGTNTTTFDGTLQSILGSTVTDFYNLVSEPSRSLSFNYDVTILNDLSISDTLISSTYDVFVAGDIVNSGIHSGNATQGGLILNGTVEQDLSGTGKFGRLNLYNPNGARILNAITLNQDLLLSDGVFNINQYLLTLGENANIVDTTGVGFSSTKMIEPNGVFSDYGIKKSFPAVADTIIFPLGISGKYTPAFLEITATAAGSVRIDCINDNHPTVIDDTEVLQYYWEVASSGISGFDGNLKLKYNDGDAEGAQVDYVAARLVIPDGTTWSKATSGSDETDNVYEASDTIVFEFNGVDNLSGEYTAGADAAIPATVPVYASNSDGDWDDPTIWDLVPGGDDAPAGGPNGFIVVISPGDSVNTNGNRRFAYRTTINGVLDVEDSYGHNLGTVDGTGRLRLEGPLLPAGRFTSFISCAGGILEYNGNTDYTIIADRIDTIRGIYFTGTGKRILPAKDLVICDTLKISGATLDNSVNKRNLTINGVFQRLNSGAFLSGSNDATVIFAGSSAQTLGGADGEFAGTNGFNNFEINNSSGLTLNSPLEINKVLTLTDGIISTTSTNILKMITDGSGDADDIVMPAAGGSSSSYIDGPMSKYISGGKDFTFPIGDGSRYGVVQTLGVNEGTWKAQYFDSGYGDYSVTGGTLTEVSQSEYWAITNPAATKAAQVKLRWDSGSDITPLTTTGGINDIVVAEFDGSDWTDIASDAPIGDDYDGIVTTTNTINIDPMYYTLGSISAILAKAYFTVLDDVCNGTSISVSFSGVDATNLDYSLTYTIDGGAPNVVAISSLPFSITTATAGDYVLTAFTYNNPPGHAGPAVAGSVDGSTVTVNAVPAQPTISAVGEPASLTLCDGESIILTSSAGTTYLWSTGATTQNISAITADNYTVQVTNAAGCLSIASAAKTVVVNPAPIVSLAVTAGLEEICNGDNTEIDLSFTAGTGPWSFTISDGTDTYGGTSGADDPYTPAGAMIPIWEGGAPFTTTTYTITLVTDANTCTNTGANTVDVIVHKVPETGNTFAPPN